MTGRRGSRLPDGGVPTDSPCPFSALRTVPVRWQDALDSSFSASGFQAHVKSFDTVGKRAEGDEVDTGLRIRDHRLEGDAAARLRLAASADHLHRLACVLGCEVVEHDAVAALCQSLLQLLEVPHLTLDLESLLAVFLAVLLGP